MSLWQLNWKRFCDQIKNNTAQSRLEWKPSELKDNIFELIGVAQQVLQIKVKGSPYRIDEETFAWNYEERR